MTTAMTPAHKQNLGTLSTMLEKMKSQIQKALPKHITPERMTRVALTAWQLTPALWDCTPLSIVSGVMQASQLGLELGNLLGHCYLVPFNNNKSGQKEAQFLIGYKGLTELAYRSGAVSFVDAHAVFEGDQFDFEYGLHQRLSHKPTGDEDPDKLTHAWACATLKDGSRKFVVLPRAAIDKTRARSRAGKSGPWVTDYAAMAIKTAVRRLCKLLPLSIESQEVIARDEAREEGRLDPETVILPSGEIGLIDHEPEPPSKVEELKAKIGEKKNKPPKAISPEQITKIQELSTQLRISQDEATKMLEKYGTDQISSLTHDQGNHLLDELEYIVREMGT